MMSKIQNLNGTHNILCSSPSAPLVVYDVKDTKFEWNSQRCHCWTPFAWCCLWCQRYKIWMELTTIVCYGTFLSKLFMMSKIQNLNGTHNTSVTITSVGRLFMMSKIQNLNGTHNDWIEIVILFWLFMMSKIQNLNGTHNGIVECPQCLRVVYDVKDTKFEWNSQPANCYSV